jgi:bifunctional oligoribonuclease and PAP phosphatase NrnA
MNLTTNTSLADIASRLAGAEKIAIVSHLRPDADAIGSLMGLALSLEKMGKNVVPVLEDGVPENLAFLPRVEIIRRPDDLGSMEDIDLVVVVDTASKERIGLGCVTALSHVKTWINIDHHGTNPSYGDLFFVDSRQPAAGQIIYDLLQEAGMPMDDSIRQHLYAAISTDTGSFQYSSTNPHTLRIAAELMEAGLDHAELCRLLYQTFPKRRLQLQRAVLNEMTFRADDRIASWILTHETQRSADVQPGDTEGLIDILRCVDTVVAAVIFEEMAEGRVRVSARSKDLRLNVANVCALFEGGGHAMAAGARLRGPTAEVAERFLQVLENEVRRIA